MFPALSYGKLAGPAKLRDVYYGGNGRITATTKDVGTPDFPVGCRVRLIREHDGVIIRETWSDPVTGVYSFDYIDPTLLYSVSAWDHTNTYNAVIASNLTPDIIP